jgi:hypothetical protein
MRLWLRLLINFSEGTLKRGVEYISKANEKSAKLCTQNLSLHCQVCMAPVYPQKCSAKTTFA